MTEGCVSDSSAYSSTAVATSSAEAAQSRPAHGHPSVKGRLENDPRSCTRARGPGLKKLSSLRAALPGARS